MSFTRQAKSELLQSGFAAPCCRRSELAAFILLRGYLSLREGCCYLVITAGNSAIARRLFSNLKEITAGTPMVVKKQGGRLARVQYLVQFPVTDRVVRPSLKQLWLAVPGGHFSRRWIFPPGLERRCCRRAFLRGIFMAGGSLSVPRSGYHLELNSGFHEDARFLRQMLQSFSLEPACRKRKDSYSLYFKDGDSIAEFLRIVGASRTLLALENRRVVKSMRNTVNRLVNCDTANLEKVVVSAQRQLAAIRKVEHTIGLDNLPPGLKEAARLRLCFPEASLRELGAMLTPPVGKSGMNHRYRRLERLATGPGKSPGQANGEM